MRIQAVLLVAAAAFSGCSGRIGPIDTPSRDAASLGDSGSTPSVTRYVFVIAMENHDANQILGNATDAPYINDVLLPAYAQATNFGDALPLGIPSEPHYVWMEAGTNAFADVTFTNDAVPSAANSTASTAHLVTQIENANVGTTWMTYQEGLDATTGACPIAASGFYQPKHDPFLFFRDVSGDPPSQTNTYCAAHHRDYSALAADLASGTVANYVFITPNQCNDMHGQSGCPNANTVRAGDDWLAAELPALITFVNAHDGVIFVTWDEGSATSRMPFLAIGPHVRAGYAGSVTYTHSSLLKSIERIFALPYLPTVVDANDFADLFVPGYFP